MSLAEEKGSLDVTKEVKKEDGNDSKAKDENGDVVYLQDVGFNVNIQAPNMDTFTIQVSSMELVQEIHQLLMDREDTSHRTCFSLQLNGVTLDNFAELKTIEGLKEGSTLTVVEEPFTVREARIHVRHVRDLLKAADDSDAFFGTECASLSYLNYVCQDVAGVNERGNRNKGQGIDCTPPDFILPNSGPDRPLTPLHPSPPKPKLSCLKIFTPSAWNPPPGPRRLRGDLMYLFVVTLEEKRFHITASTRGFFVNETSELEFNPRPCAPGAAGGAGVHHSMVDLLSALSPLFKKNFATLQKRRTSKHPFERVATPYQVFSWMSPPLPHTLDALRAEDAFSSKLGYEEHIPGQTRDWNEEMQTTRELPRKTLPERLIRERAIFKVHSDFVAAATRGAVAVIDGAVMAINPGEEHKMQMFIWNNIFFSLGFDVRDHYKELGGDAAAFVAPRNDLQGVRVYNAVDLEGLYTLGTVVVDYRGYRVTAQSIIPGILEREQEQSVVYGSIDFGKTVVASPKYIDLLQKAGSQLKIMPHAVMNEKGEEVLLCSSVECKGIVGNDGRHYILDLLRTFPPDINFLPEIEGIEMSKEATALGLPIKHKHKLSCLRQELIDAFVESRYLMFIKYAAVQLQQLGLKKQMDFISGAEENKNEPKSLETDKDTNKDSNKEKLGETEARKIVESLTENITASAGTDKMAKREIMEESTRDIVKKAAQAVGSLKETEFDIRFNPDVFSPGVTHPPGEIENLDKQKALVKDSAEFLITVQIPAFIRDCLEHAHNATPSATPTSSPPMDGPTLSDNLHNRGINIRYLGILANMLSKVPQLSHVHQLVVSEVLTRSAKHVFTNYIQNVDLTLLASSVAHFFNCFFCAGATAAEITDKVSKNKKKGKKVRVASRDNDSWTSLTAKSLWATIKQEASEYYNFDLNQDNIEEICTLYQLQKVSLLRSFCMKTGVQLRIREFFLGNAAAPAIFSDEDVINIFPRPKHVNPRASDAYNFYTTGQSKIQQGYLKDGYELISEALNLLNNVYGAMHPEIAQCQRMLARLNYILGDYAEALAYQQKAVLMSERVNGVDHPYTITEYVHLALYCFANSQISAALKLLYRARYLCLLVIGENHPEVALIDSNIGLILHAVGEYDLSLKFLEKSLELSARFYGSGSLKVAVAHHLVARTQSCMGDFRSALLNEKETFLIYKAQLGDEHDKTKESSECLRHLTQQAVVLQKKMNEIYSGKTGTAAGLPPIQIQSPSMGSVLDMLNVINGILFVQISKEDIENFRAEFEKKAAVTTESQD